jgi:hypothetical protein
MRLAKSDSANRRAHQFHPFAKRPHSRRGILKVGNLRGFNPWKICGETENGADAMEQVLKLSLLLSFWI